MSSRAFRVAAFMLFAAVSSLSASSALADEFTSTDYQVLDPVIQPAGYATSSAYQLWSTMSEVALGTSSASSFSLGAGFLRFPAVATSSGGGGGGGSGGGGNSGGPFVFGPIIQIPSLQVIPKVCEKISADMDCDGRVDIIDFSIMYYWYRDESPPARVDLNKDGAVDIYDFSIMAYYWTE